MKPSALDGGVVNRLSARKTAKDIIIPQTGGQSPRGFIPVTYMLPTASPPITMLQKAPSAVAFLQKKVPHIAGNCISNPPEAMDDKTAIMFNLYWAKSRQTPVIIGINILLSKSSFSSGMFGFKALRMSLPNMELNVNIMEFMVETAAAIMLSVTIRARGYGTMDSRRGMALSATDIPGINLDADMPKNTHKRV